MGGHQVPGRGPGDDGYDEDGYDESQRAEILEVTRDGPTDGTIVTDLNPDLGEEIDEDETDELGMVADEAAEDEAAEDEAGEADDSDELNA
ncbi:DNA primase [Sphingomonas koreensis]